MINDYHACVSAPINTNEKKLNKCESKNSYRKLEDKNEVHTAREVSAYHVLINLIWEN